MVSWHHAGLGWRFFDESTTQQPVSDRKQLHQRRKWGVWVPLWDTIHNHGGLNKRQLTQEIVGHPQPSHVCSPTLIVYILLTSFPLLSISKALFCRVTGQCLLSSLALFCTESSFDEISRRNSWPANSMTAVPKGMTSKNKIKTKTMWNQSSWRIFTCMNNYCFCVCKFKIIPQLRFEPFPVWFVGSSMEHQHSTRVTEPAPRIVQGLKAACPKY